MANSYNWKIYQFDAKVAEDGKSNVIYNVHFGYTGVSDQDSSTQFTIHNVAHLDSPSNNFIEYDNITEQDVISWIEAKVDIQEYKNAIDAEIEKQLNPTDIHLKPKWNTIQN